MAELEAMKAQVVVEEQNREVVLKFYEELDKGNTDNALETFAPDFLYYSPSNG
jgi:ketosteroid isomerase-like protein